MGDHINQLIKAVKDINGIGKLKKLYSEQRSKCDRGKGNNKKRREYGKRGK